VIGRQMDSGKQLCTRKTHFKNFTNSEIALKCFEIARSKMQVNVEIGLI
jgi:hypothetical protein